MALYSYCNSCGKRVPYRQSKCDECKTEYYRQCADNRNQDEKEFYNSPTWKRLRREVLEDSHYMCEACKREGNITKATDVHHIQRVLDAWDKRYDYDNCVALCRACHVGVHNGEVCL